MNAKRLPEKDPGETVVLCWDFTDDIGTDEDSPPTAQITGTPDIAIEVDQSLYRGVDPDVDDMLVGLPELLGKQVFQAVAAGIHGVDYKVRCAVDIDSVPSTRLYKTSILPVRVQ